MTDTNRERERRSDPEIVVLLVDADEGVLNSVTGYSERNLDDLEFVGVSSGETALEWLASEPFDCVVAEPTSPEVDEERFVDDVRAHRPDCPVIWLTEADPRAMDDATLDSATSIVEKGEDRGDWSFLVQKIRGAVKSGPPHSGDPETFETLVESARDGLYRLDANARVTYLNESFAEMLGYDRDALYGVHASSVMAKGELERGQQVVQAVIADDDRESAIMDMDMVTRTGERITVSVNFVVDLGENGTYQGLMGVVRDITERKEYERRLERERDRLDEFTSLVSHDLRNPLNVAQGQLSLAREDCESEHLALALDALDRMERLIDDLRELAQQGKLVDDPEPVVLDAAITRASAMLDRQEAVHRDLGETTVLADEDRLVQLFENLFQNSLEHGGPEVTIRVGTLAAGEGFYVEDDGPGIPTDERPSVFDHGYSTSEDGTGFGLSIVQSIVEGHGWTIEVTDGSDGGARFEVACETHEDPDSARRSRPID